MSQQLTNLVHALLQSSAEGHKPAIWKPAADVYRGQRGWLIKFELAGVRFEDIQLEAAGRCLKLRGVRRDWSVAEARQAYSMEISYSRFERSVELPCDVEGAKISARYQDGMLLVEVMTEGQP